MKREKKQSRWVTILKMFLVFTITISYMTSVFITTPPSGDKVKTLAWVLIVGLSCAGYFKFLDWAGQKC